MAKQPENLMALANSGVAHIRQSRIIHKTMAEEGGYVDSPKLIDQPTNSGITQPTLDKYNSAHPNFYFPANVKELTDDQAKQIYHDIYYQELCIDKINNERIANTVFDMTYQGGRGIT